MKKLTALLVLVFAVQMTFGQTPCPVQGNNKSLKFQTADRLKNRSVAGTKIDQSVTLEKILAPGNDTARFNSNQYVAITGYVVLVKPGGLEYCECHSKDPKDWDIHIEIALSPNDGDKKAMIVEINRYTKAKNPNYTVANIKKFLGKKVVVTGWLFSDSEHKQNAVNTNPKNDNDWRGTIWEIHPVISIVQVN